MSQMIENASFYKRAVETFDLPPERADKIAAQMQKLGVGRDDAYMMLFLATARVEQLTETIPAEILKAGRQTAGAVRKAVDESLTAMPDKMTAELDGHMQKVASSLAETTQTAIDREARRRDMTRLGAAGLGALIVAVLALGGGYIAGRNQMTTEAASWAALQSLSDGPKWLALARLNPSLDKALGQGCAVGQGRVVAGGRVCDVPLAVTAPVASSKGTDAVRLSFAEWSYRLGSWGLLGIGTLLGLALSWGFRRTKPRY